MTIGEDEDFHRFVGIFIQFFTYFQFDSPKEDQYKHFILTLDLQSPCNAEILFIFLSLLD